MTPVALRKEAREERRKGKKQQAVKRWNPATYFILIFMLIGSFGIHFINLRQSYALESRRAENRIAMLQEVLRRVQAGEDVDVEKMLGTGDPLAEQEWEEGIFGPISPRIISKADPGALSHQAYPGRGPSMAVQGKEKSEEASEKGGARSRRGSDRSR